MKKTIVLILAAFMLAASLTSCRITARKHIRPLFFHITASSMRL
ncbi:hypothetical protein AALB39_22590 [Lachnospiraceae bacterium 54-53]